MKRGVGGGMSFSSQFLGGVLKISTNVTEGIRGGHHKSFNDKKKLLLPSSLQRSLCVTRRLGRGDLKGACRGRKLPIVVGYGKGREYGASKNCTKKNLNHHSVPPPLPPT